MQRQQCRIQQISGDITRFMDVVGHWKASIAVLRYRKLLNLRQTGRFVFSTSEGC
jgi:hypothetical protein